MDVAHDFQQAESTVQRNGGSEINEGAAQTFKKLDERFEEVSACIAKALELEDPPEDPSIFSVPIQFHKHSISIHSWNSVRMAPCTKIASRGTTR